MLDIHRLLFLPANKGSTFISTTVMALFVWSCVLKAQIPFISQDTIIYTSAQLDARIKKDRTYHVNNRFIVDCQFCTVLQDDRSVECLLSGQYGIDIYRGSVNDNTFLDNHVAGIPDADVWRGRYRKGFRIFYGRTWLNRNFTAYNLSGSSGYVYDASIGYIANIYVVSKDVWIGFVHIERAPVTLKKTTAVNRNYAIGIASSTNHGREWTYYGDVIRPKLDATALPLDAAFQNIGGVPFVVVDNGGEKYFYVYFNEFSDAANSVNVSTSVAREKISNVLQLLRENAGKPPLKGTSSTPWKKYNVDNGSAPWGEDGLTGAGTDILVNERYRFQPAYYYNFDMHTDATYIKAANVYALIVNATKAKGTHVAANELLFFQSSNGIDWKNMKTIATSAGNKFIFQHISIMPLDMNGNRDGSMVNNKFAIIYSKFPTGGGEVHLDKPEIHRIDVWYPPVTSARDTASD